MDRILFACLIFSTITLSGQGQWEGGLLLGASFYQGDLTPSIVGTLHEPQPAGGLFIRRHLGPKLAVRAQAFRGKLSGDDSNFSDYSSRAFSFSTDITEFSLLLEWRLFSPVLAGSRLAPYFFAGGGLLEMAPRPELLNQPAGPPPRGVKEDAQAVYGRSRFTLPFGFGLEYSLNRHWSVGVEGGLRTAFTDYLDGISFAGNPTKKDWYGFAGFSLAYRWGARDRDGDGVADAEDACPSQAGLAIHDGCPDTDADGIPDKEDDCPLLAGALKGCPDSDGDGVADHTDQCPGIPGPLFRAGCPSEDSDGDGILDAEDRCPQQIGPASRQGCPLLDSDQDGIENERDQCPQIPGSSTNFGCPEAIGQTETSYRLFFETNSASLDGQQQQLLNSLAAALSRQPAASLLIKGHADEQGTEESDRQLSMQRARACYEYLLKRGALPQQMHYDGFGAVYPLNTDNSEASRYLNRRVELELQLQ
ncbi:MAG: OmpA family protein [Phaeodactylibacter sp.]|nr:OmpA family protein [Phaeodactylibacter sp.]MCB9265237.1 OmpA family protein [Lewinellaceae bacterium]MCB9290169.1 OmpA family protein [Lewinellaceae bacterium]